MTATTMKKYLIPTATVVLTIVAFSACNNSQDSKSSTGDTSMTQKQSEVAGEKISLFDGKTFNGWHSFNGGPQVTSWMIEDSSLVCLGTAKDAHGGDIVTDSNYQNFELSWDWKVSKGANSGVMYHVVEDPKYKAPYETGPEYQIIDDIGFPGKLEEWQKAGADYAMYLPNEKKKLKPVGEWNSSKIVFNRGQAEYWLNGEKILEFQAWSEDWNKKKVDGKWKDYPDYGMAKTGKIALQDHGNKVYYRNIWIHVLPSN